MATNPTPPSPPSKPTELVNSLLDAGYTEATGQVMRALTRNHSTGLMQQRLDEFEKEAARLEAAGEALTADNAIFRALMADFEATLKRDAGAVDGASGDTQASGTAAGETLAQQLTLTGLGSDAQAVLRVGWNKPDPQAIAQVVNYVNSEEWQQQIGQFGDDLLDPMLNAVIGGIAEGKSPGSIARELRGLNDDLPLWKANNLLRTLQLTSYRDAMSLSYTANTDILETQIRIGTLDGRICLCCLALHGTELAIGERVDDHHQGRCTSIAVLKGRPWAVQSGQAYWDSLDEAAQRELAGHANFEAIKAGAATLQDFVQKYTDPVFGDMVREASLKGILGARAKDFYKYSRN